MVYVSEFTLSELDTLIDAYSYAAQFMNQVANEQAAEALTYKAAYYQMERGNIARGDLVEADPNDHNRDGYQIVNALQNAEITFTA